MKARCYKDIIEDNELLQRKLTGGYACLPIFEGYIEDDVKPARRGGNMHGKISCRTRKKRMKPRTQIYKRKRESASHQIKKIKQHRKRRRFEKENEFIGRVL